MALGTLPLSEINNSPKSLANLLLPPCRCCNFSFSSSGVGCKRLGWGWGVLLGDPRGCRNGWFQQTTPLPLSALPASGLPCSLHSNFSFPRKHSQLKTSLTNTVLSFSRTRDRHCSADIFLLGSHWGSEKSAQGGRDVFITYPPGTTHP